MGPAHIVAETQSGFITDRHISKNIRLMLDLLDSADSVQSEAFILFLDFYKAFHTVEHTFLTECLQLFGFGNQCIDTIEMFYKGIDSSVIINYSTSNRLDRKRGVRRGCPLSPFLFVSVVELLSVNIEHDPDFKGFSVFNRERRISQLADDTTLFLKDKEQLLKAVDPVQQLSSASGLKLHVWKCELWPIHTGDDTFIDNIPVKTMVKCLGIHITKH